MALDGIVLRKITDQLKTCLPARIIKINSISDTEILFQLKNANERFSLLISCHSQFNRINLTDKKYPIPSEPSNFVMLLRKHLENGLLASIEQGGLDRYLTMTIHTHNEIGDPISRFLFIELMGKYANIILTDETLKILDALKRIPPFENTKRTLQPGAVFTFPEDQHKLDPFIAQTYDPQQSFTNQFSGFSPLLSKEMEYRLHNNETFTSIMQTIRESEQIYVSESQGQIYFHIIPLLQFQQPVRAFPIMAGLDELYFYKEEVDRIRQQTGDLFKFVRHELKKNEQKLLKLQDALDEANDCAKWQLYGDLLYAYQQQVTKGLTQASLIDFTTGEPVLIPLDPKLGAKQNAKKCFQKYNKGKKGQQHIQEQLRNCQNEIDYFTTLQQQLTIIDFKDAEEIKEELVDYGYLAATRRKKTGKKSALNYLTIRYNDNTTIYVGKNNRQNDFLTFKAAAKTDYWFHALDYHGSHTIVKTDSLDETIIRLAATFAAYFSQARESSSIPVAYTQVKNLKKIPKAKLGLVSMTNNKTIYIDIDKSKLKQYITLKEIT
ncbi:MAG: NFACT RNA binding domain-containing protein [Erysipelotrichaceae bacterium]|nr:NFACT RNA binding domain-containing protein [Erysipelotrichaceae bacterium]